MRKKILTRILSFLRVCAVRKLSDKTSDLCGNDFNIILDKEHKELAGPRNFVIVSPNPFSVAGPTWEGAVRLFPSLGWIELSLKDIISILSHEIMHITIGQDQGMIISEKYDKLMPCVIEALGSPYTSDLFKRVGGT